jgi:hypothetical protein
MFILIYVIYTHIYCSARSQRRQTWALAEEDAVGIAAQSVESGNLASVESGNFTAGKNVAWSSDCTQVIVSAVLFASIPLGGCGPEAAGTMFQHPSRCLRTGPEAVGMDVR